MNCYTIVYYEREPGVRPKEVFVMGRKDDKCVWLTANCKWRQWLGSDDKRMFAHPSRFSAYSKLKMYLKSISQDGTIEKARVDFIPGDTVGEIT